MPAFLFCKVAAVVSHNGIRSISTRALFLLSEFSKDALASRRITHPHH